MAKEYGLLTSEIALFLRKSTETMLIAFSVNSTNKTKTQMLANKLKQIALGKMGKKNPNNL